jgi:AsmA protein
LQFIDVDLENCLGDLFQFRRLEGRGDVELAIDASGNSVLALTRTMNGSSRLAGRQGAMVGLNVEQLLRRLERRPLSGTGDFRNGRTPFEKLTVDIKIVQGTATVENVNLEGSKVRLGLSGSASIPARDFDLRGVAALATTAASDTAPAFELPFMVQGPWDDPIFLPDTQSLMQRSPLASPLLNAVKNRSSKDTVRDAIERLTGGALSPPAGAQPAER